MIISKVSNPVDCDDEYKCEICININILPYTLVPCGHTVCEKCLKKIKECPFCRRRVSDTVMNYALKNIIEKHNIEYLENIKKFVSFFKPVLNSCTSLKKLLEHKEIGTNLYERILVIEKLFELLQNDDITIINEEEKIGIYNYNNYYYASYNDILMIDIDGDYTIEEISEELNKTNESFDIYKTRKGYHAFMTSRRVNFHDKDTLKFMCSIDMCDTNYTLFTWLNKKAHVRLNRKSDEGYKSGKLYEYAFSIGNSSLIDIINDVNLHNIFTMCYADIQNIDNKPFNKLNFLFEDLINVDCDLCYNVEEELVSDSEDDDDILNEDDDLLVPEHRI